MSQNFLKSLSRKVLQCGSIIDNCLMKYVQQSDFNLNYILLFYTYLYVHKILNDQYSPCLRSYFTVYETHHNTRFCHNFAIQRALKSKTHISLRWFGPRLWNKLPLNLKKCQSFQTFKTLVPMFVKTQIFLFYST